MKALFMIINAGFADDVMAIARDAGIKGATILNARGEGAEHKSFMGITLDTEKEIILSLTNEKIATKAMNAVQEKAGVKTPAGSVCFTIPVEKTIGLTTYHK